jgi:hypothetical protein
VALRFGLWGIKSVYGTFQTNLYRWVRPTQPRNRGHAKLLLATIYTLSFWMGAVLV